MVVSEELFILASCLLRPMSRNSVLEEFRVRRFAVNQEEKFIASAFTGLVDDATADELQLFSPAA